MTERENLQAQQEAKEAVTRRAGASGTLTSADRARLWAGMNRYLAAELERARQEKDATEKAEKTEKTASHSRS
jgi:hypothetical protein